MSYDKVLETKRDKSAIKIIKIKKEARNSLKTCIYTEDQMGTSQVTKVDIPSV